MRGFQYLIKPFSENAEQQCVVNYLKTRYPNVLFTTGLMGIRLPAWAMWLLNALGYRSGTPDISIYEPRSNYHGLFIEMKRPRREYIDDGKKKIIYPEPISPAQKEFHLLLIDRGYQTEVCYGADAAIKIIDGYFDLQDKK